MTRDALATCSPHIPFHHLLFRPFLPPPTTTRPVVFSRSLAVRPVPRAGQRKSPAAGLASVFSNGSLKFNGRKCWTNTSKAGGWWANNAATGRAETTYGASGCRPQARFGKSRGESRRAKSRLGKHFGLRSGYARNRFPQRRYAPRLRSQQVAHLPTKNYRGSLDALFQAVESTRVVDR